MKKSRLTESQIVGILKEADWTFPGIVGKSGEVQRQNYNREAPKLAGKRLPATPMPDNTSACAVTRRNSRHWWVMRSNRTAAD